MQLSQAQFDALRDSMDAVPTAASSVIESKRYEWTDDAPAASDYADVPGEPVKTIVSHAAHALTVGADHLAGLRRVLQSPVMTIAPWTLARGNLEACSLLLWLLEDGLTASDRIGRSLSIRIQNLRDQRVWSGEHGTAGEEPQAAARQRTDEVAEQARTMGLEVRRAKNGEVIGFPTGLPGFVELARRAGYAPEYRLFSGAAHGRFWATTQLGFRRSGRNALEQDMTPEAAIYVLTVSLELWLKAAAALSLYQGWDLNEIGTALDPLLDSAGLSSGMRPWRNSAP